MEDVANEIILIESPSFLVCNRARRGEQNEERWLKLVMEEEEEEEEEEERCPGKRREARNEEHCKGKMCYV